MTNIILFIFLSFQSREPNMKIILRELLTSVLRALEKKFKVEILY